MLSTDHISTDAGVAFEAGQALQASEQEVQNLDGGTPFLILDGKVVSLEPHLLKPTRHKAKPVFSDAVSFIEYVKKYVLPGTMIFSKIGVEGGVFTAALDLAAPGDTSWNDHSATFKLEATQDWKTWTQMNRKWMSQDDFVQFVETQRHVFQEPSSATMLEIAQSIEATVGGAFKSSFRNDNGDRTLVLDMTTVATYTKGEAKIDIPQEITIAIAPFEGQNPYPQSAFLRFRKSDSGAVFQYELQRPEETIRQSADEARARISNDTGLPVLNGTFVG